MSVSAIGGMSHQVAFTAAHAAAKPESSEAAGRPDHDGDSDDRGAASAHKVDVKA